MRGGNSATVAAGRADRRGIRDRVDGGDKEHQTDQPDGIFIFQSILETKEAIPLASTPIHSNNGNTFHAPIPRALSQTNRRDILPEHAVAPQRANGSCTGDILYLRHSAAEFHKIDQACD
jgi:hypothetical protein